MDIASVRVAVLGASAPECRAIIEALAACGISGVKSYEDISKFCAGLRNDIADLAVLALGRNPQTGFSVLKRIRSGADEINPYMPVIAAQAAPTASVVRDAFDSGAHEFLVLPTNVKSISAIIHRAVFISRPFIKSATYCGPCRRRRMMPAYNGPERRLKPWAGYTHAAHKAEERETARQMAPRRFLHSPTD